MGRRTCSPLATYTDRQFHLFNDLSARIVRTSVCHRRSSGTSTRICSLTRGKWLRIRVDVLTIPVFVAHGLNIRAYEPRIYSPCATDTGKQGELDLCRYLHICIGLATVHRCPQLLASLENSSPELWKICPPVCYVMCYVMLCYKTPPIY